MRRGLLIVAVLLAALFCVACNRANDDITAADTNLEPISTPAPAPLTPIPIPTPPPTPLPALQQTPATQSSAPVSSYISEYGRQAAENFLSQFTSIFTGIQMAEYNLDNNYADTGRFWPQWPGRPGWQHLEEHYVTYEMPPLFWRNSPHGITGVFDSNDNQRFEDELWLHVHRWANLASQTEHAIYWYAADFTLFDLDITGIPDIFILFRPIFDGWDTGPRAFYTIFRYVDGQYRQMTLIDADDPGAWVRWIMATALFFDAYGRLILVHDDEHDSYHTYVHLTFEGDYVKSRRIVSIEWREWDEWYAWREHHWHDWRETADGWTEFDSWMHHNPTIFGTDIALIPIRPHVELQNEIRTSIIERYFSDN